MNTTELILKLHEIGSIKFGEFKLKSGLLSPVYIDIREIISYPNILTAVAELMWDKISSLNFQVVCGVPYTALPIATVLSTTHDIPMVMRRKEIKDYGTKKAIEGNINSGDNCLVIEDLITSGQSIFETIEPLEQAGLTITNIVVLLDREQGGRTHIENKGYHVHVLFTMTELLTVLEENNNLNSDTVNQVKKFITDNQI